ncbi:hypothetical protein ACLBOM_26165 [Escherichia coli]
MKISTKMRRTMAVIDPVKLVMRKALGEGEMVTMPNHTNKPEMGSRQVPFDGEISIDRADFREEANKQYKRLVLGKDGLLRNAYVIKAERVRRVPKAISPPSSVLMTPTP